MPADVDAIARAVARSKWLDGYTLWRTLKDVEAELYALQRAQIPVPFGLVRMRAIIRRARALRDKIPGGLEGAGSAHLESATAQTGPDFDPFDFVDPYLALGGRREASVRNETMGISQFNEETPQAAEYWSRGFSKLSRQQRHAVATCLFLRGKA
jgi:hypothetical protein